MQIEIPDELAERIKDVLEYVSWIVEERDGKKVAVLEKKEVKECEKFYHENHTLFPRHRNVIRAALKAGEEVEALTRIAYYNHVRLQEGIVQHKCCLNPRRTLSSW